MSFGTPVDHDLAPERRADRDEVRERVRARREIDIGAPRVGAHLPEQVALELLDSSVMRRTRVPVGERRGADRGTGRAVGALELLGDAERQEVVEHDAAHPGVDERLAGAPRSRRECRARRSAAPPPREVVGRVAHRRGRHPLRDVVTQPGEPGAERMLEPGLREQVRVPGERLHAQQQPFERLHRDVVILVDHRVEVEAGHDRVRVAAALARRRCARPRAARA